MKLVRTQRTKQPASQASGVERRGSSAHSSAYSGSQLDMQLVIYCFIQFVYI